MALRDSSPQVARPVSGLYSFVRSSLWQPAGHSILCSACGCCGVCNTCGNFPASGELLEYVGARRTNCLRIGSLVLLFDIAALAAAAILTKDRQSGLAKRFSNSCRVFAETLGAPRVLYTVVLLFALYVYHRNSPRQYVLIASAWLITAVASPFEEAFHLGARLRRIWQPDTIVVANGEVIAYQTPGVILIRQQPASQSLEGKFLAIQDPLGKFGLALAIDNVGEMKASFFGHSRSRILLLLRAFEIKSRLCPRMPWR